MKLDIIAEDGSEAIHNGSLTAALASDIQAFGGIVTEDDLRNYKGWPGGDPQRQSHRGISERHPGLRGDRHRRRPQELQVIVSSSISLISFYRVIKLDMKAEDGPEAIHNGSLTAALASDIQAFGGIVTEDDLRNYKNIYLYIIAEDDPEAIHNGSLTAALASDIQAFGGIVTEDDLRNYKVEWQDPIAVPLAEGRILYSVPLPGSGSVLAFILNMLRDWVGGGTDAPAGSDLYWHRIIETFKYAYAKRTGLGDASRTNLPYLIRELERNLSDPAWAESYRAAVDDARTYSDWRHYGAMFEGADDHGTAHVVVVAPDGSVVSATSTINYM
ncbi:gamma-glutamyltranspeptidase domain-containing protein [Phthorimaea operculella]|nr:gamma-glutamyltranspeptidase domain-containing protein [Phthorimaea operculella]